MKLFDFNIHLPQKVSDDVNEVIADDLNLDVQGLINGLDRHYPGIQHVSGANILLFNQRLFHRDPELFRFIAEVKKKFESFLLTALIDFRQPAIDQYLECAISEGVHTFMFNSYLQQISDVDFDSVLKVCKCAEVNKKIICIDGSYGTSKMYAYNNMKLACFVAEHITKVPIVIIHSGGYRVIDAMWLAVDKKNVVLETSFSLNYYLGSSLEQDYAFVYKRLGAKRVLFGSDVPYLDFDKAYSEQLDFFGRNGFSSNELEHIFYENAIGLADGYW
jgi:uncharacterized protein